MTSSDSASRTDYFFKERSSKKSNNKHSASSLFDVRKFDKILDLIFPSGDPSVVKEVYSNELSTPDAHTPEDLFVENKPPW